MEGLWIVVILLSALTVALLSGKGGFLIAGYNTLSKEDKEFYNAKRLCKQVGVLLLLITIPTIILAIIETVGAMQDIHEQIFAGYVVLTICGFMFYLNKSNPFK